VEAFVNFLWPAGQPRSWGQCSPKQRRVIKSIIAGRVVHDLGAGSGAMAELLVELGARSVILVDQDEDERHAPKGSTRLTTSFFALAANAQRIDVAFVSWPPTSAAEVAGLPTLCGSAETVIYLGKSTDGTACGSSDLFERFLRREVLHYVPERRNTLIVYGKVRGLRTRLPRGEELAGLLKDCCGIFSFDLVQRLDREIGSELLQQRQSPKRKGSPK
jgi:hypothetical protein